MIDIAWVPVIGAFVAGMVVGIAVGAITASFMFVSKKTDDYTQGWNAHCEYVRDGYQDKL